VIVKCISDKVQFNAEKFNAMLLAQTERSKTMLVCHEPGQAIPVHHPHADLTLFVLEGRAHLVAGDEELALAGPGAIMCVEAGQARGIRALERTVAVVVVSPPPTAEDHREVAAHLAKGTWR